EETAHTWIYNTHTKEWKECAEVASVFPHLWMFGACLTGGKVHFVGGQANNHISFTLPTEEEPKGKWSKHPNMPFESESAG
ncbi:hypothetical protein KIPB_017120, partial [Kipferlia bialata]